MRSYGHATAKSLQSGSFGRCRQKEDYSRANVSTQGVIDVPLQLPEALYLKGPAVIRSGRPSYALPHMSGHEQSVDRNSRTGADETLLRNSFAPRLIILSE